MIAQLYAVLPEIAILVSGCVVLIADLFVPRSMRHVSFWLTQIALLVTIWIVVATAQLAPVHAFSGMVVDDMLSDVLKLFALVAVSLMLFYSRAYLTAGTLPGRDVRAHAVLLLGMMG
jgi:NADH-quinone oxidoreductase subunit N